MGLMTTTSALMMIQIRFIRTFRLCVLYEFFNYSIITGHSAVTKILVEYALLLVSTVNPGNDKSNLVACR